MWRARPIFISSTFVDMQAERDYLRTRVFPELEERLRARRHNLEWVDLRIGVATASQHDSELRELHVLKVCLAEVRRCRPFLIVLLGDRYGWVPPEDRIRAAAEEAREGFSADVAGRSVTDLEIDFGVLSDSEQQPRSIFYFREPLPYADMPAQIATLYSEEYATDEKKAVRAHRLAALKRRIEQQLPTRVRHYAVQWDAAQQRVTGLDAWGRMVVEDLWSELEAETRATATEADITWDQAERQALEDFVDDRARDFIGRQEILERLIKLATEPENAGSIRGACVIGDPGSGKSAFFGRLYHRFQGSGVFLLCHAAGASNQAASVDFMLRRWITELATALDIRDVGLAENADAKTVEATFTRLLWQKSSLQRVVVLVDALDQFEATPRGRFATWVPRLLPSNARLIAMGIAGDACNSLAERLGTDSLSLGSLNATEARGIIQAICGRYHRTFESEVINALLAKGGPAGPAWKNPLWLVLAVEELNLLDADDFDRARMYAGRPGEQMRTLMLENIATFPDSIPGLYRHTFERAEKQFGATLVRSFLELIAAGRAGWRESDFRILLPRISGEYWDGLKFAQIRRSFRGQLRRRGPLAQWDFNHAQMRAAVRSRPTSEKISERKLHRIIADLLLSCPSDDPLHITETMVHLLGSEDYVRAARYYGDSLLGSAEAEAATRVLADAIIAPAHGAATTAAREICRLLDTTEHLNSGASHRFLFDLGEVIERNAPVDARLIVFESIKQAFDKLASLNPDNLGWRRDLSLASSKVGDAQKAQGKLEGALKANRESRATAEQLMVSDPRNLEWHYLLSAASERIGAVQEAQGDLTGAIESYRLSLTIVQGLAPPSPPLDPDGRHNRVSAALNKVGDVQLAQGELADARKTYADSLAIAERLAQSDPENAFWQNGLASSYGRLSVVQEAQGDLEGALKSAREAVVIDERLAELDRGDARRQRALSLSYQRFGDVQKNQADLASAIKSFRASSAITNRLAQSDPGNADWQRDLSLSYARVGAAQREMGDLEGALNSYRASSAITDLLAQSDPSNTAWQEDLSVILSNVGDVQRRLGDLPGALRSCRDSLGIARRLAEFDPGDADWRYHLSATLSRIGDVQRALLELTEALTCYKDSLLILNHMAQSDPGRLRWQIQFQRSEVLSNIGYVQLLQSKPEHALKSFHDSLLVLDHLARSNPNNLRWEHELSVAYANLGRVFISIRETTKGRHALQQSRAIMGHVTKLLPTNAEWKNELAWLDGEITSLPEGQELSPPGQSIWSKLFGSR